MSIIRLSNRQIEVRVPKAFTEGLLQTIERESTVEIVNRQAFKRRILDQIDFTFCRLDRCGVLSGKQPKRNGCTALRNRRFAVTGLTPVTLPEEQASYSDSRCLGFEDPNNFKSGSEEPHFSYLNVDTLMAGFDAARVRVDFTGSILNWCQITKPVEDLESDTVDLD